MAFLLNETNDITEDEFRDRLNSQRIHMKPPDKYAAIMYAHRKLWFRVLEESIYWIYEMGQSGYWEGLNVYFSDYNKYTNLKSMKFDHLLVSVARKLNIKSKNSIDYGMCVDIISDIPNININYMDDYECTAIMYTVRYKYDILTWKLMSKHAFIGDICVKQMDPHFLEAFLNRSIISQPSENDESISNGIISFNYRNFIKPVAMSSQYIGSSDVDIMWSIMMNKKIKHLISHPLFEYLIWTKWNRMYLYIWWNYLLCFLLITIDIYIGIFYKIDTSGFLTNLMRICLLPIVYIGWLILTIRWLYRNIGIRLTTCKLKYITMTQTWIQLFLIASITTLLFYIKIPQSIENSLSAVIFLLSAYDLTIIIQSFNHLAIATYMEMFKTVVKNFFKLLIIFSFILLSFILSFYVLHRADDNQLNETSKYSNSTSDLRNNTTPSFLATSIKTIIMFTGEFNSDDMNFDDNSVFNIVFICFIFFVSLVLLNLLNGLAVTDAQEIRNKAELNRLCYSVQTINNYEKNQMMIRKIMNLGYLIAPRLCRRHLQKVLPLTNVQEIRVYPNKFSNCPKSVIDRFERDSYIEKFEIDKVNIDIIDSCYEMFKQRDKETLEYANKERFEKWKYSIEKKIDIILNKISLSEISVNVIPADEE